MSIRPVVGDTVVYTGVLGQYKGTAQMKNGMIPFFIFTTYKEEYPHSISYSTK